MAFADIRQVHILIETELFYRVFINYSLQISFQMCQLSNGVYYIFGKQKKNSYIIKKSPILLPYVLSIPNRYVKSSTVHHIKPALNLQRVQMTRRNTRSILEVLLRTDKQLINLLHFCLSEVFLQPQILILHVHVCLHVIACDITVYHLCLSALGPFPQLGLVNIFSRLWSANVQVYQSQTQ